jgi:protein-S-isoprenylcysteine O-methyltransferase Ste14
MLKKTTSVVYAGSAYLLFLGAYLYLVAFATNVLPDSVSGPASLPPLHAALADIALITLFGLQHSIMARPAFKRWWTRVVPQHLERSTYVLIAAALVIVIVRFWQPIEGDLWNLTGAGKTALYAVSLLGWLGVPAFSFLTDHFELFGLRQVFEYAVERPTSQAAFKERGVYKKVRHPMMLAFLVGFWAAPHMTIGHLLFSGLMTLYILTGIYFEERDLIRAHGQAYRDYKTRVSMLLPWVGRAEQKQEELLLAEAERLAGTLTGAALHLPTRSSGNRIREVHASTTSRSTGASRN